MNSSGTGKRMPPGWSIFHPTETKETHYMESEEAFFLDHIEYLDFKNNTSSFILYLWQGVGSPPGLPDPSLRAAYTVPVHGMRCIT